MSAGTLSDGVAMTDLIDTRRREVSMRVLSDPEIYRLELERLWGKAWIVVGHDSEIPRQGDYVVRYIGEDPVIVTRDSNGEVRALLNICSHRGMQLCRAEMGNASTFRCAYHGWAYDAAGRFVGSPIGKQKMHGDLVAKSELDLPRARVATYHGLIFATFDAVAPDLKEYLGPAAWYLDMIYGLTSSGMEVVGPPQRWIINGNWKLAAEQFVGGDTYHVMTLHRSIYELGILGTTDQITGETAPGAEGLDIAMTEGHSFRCVPFDFSPIFGNERARQITVREKLLALPPVGCTPQLVEQTFKTLTADQLRVLADSPPTVGGLFPNVATFNFLMPSADGPLGGVKGFHTFVPKGPDKLEFWHWTLVERDAPEEVKALVARTTTQTVGSSGMIECDDGECWPLTQRATRGSLGSRQTMKYHALAGENRPPDWPGGGIVCAGFSKDDGQWYWWRRYLQFLDGKAW
jgi:phenylpropionate dioxygenase-like ring-hydroxylating dioxygenase large terminal subunit